MLAGASQSKILALALLTTVLASLKPLSLFSRIGWGCWFVGAAVWAVLFVCVAYFCLLIFFP
jgi:hypothetical protein